MKILTVCGMGSGSSLILKMNIDEVLEDMGREDEVSACDLGSVGGQTADLIVTTREFGEPLQEYDIDLILLDNVIDTDKIKEELEKYFNK